MIIARPMRTMSQFVVVAAILVAVLPTPIIAAGPYNPGGSHGSHDELTLVEIIKRMQTMIQSMAITDTKLERHETRERNEALTIKKGIAALQKGQRMFERLDERMGQIETSLLVQDERLMTQQNKVESTLEAIFKWMSSNTMSGSYDVRIGTDNDNDEATKGLSKKVDELTEQIRELRGELATIKDKSKALAAETEKLVRSNLASTDEIFTKLDDKLSHFYVPLPPSTTPLPAQESRPSQWEYDVLQAIKQIKEQLKQTPADHSKLADREFMQALANETLGAIQEIRSDVVTASDKSLIKTGSRIKESHDSLESAINEMMRITQEASAVSETFYGDAANNYSAISDALKGFGKMETVLMRSADDVLDTKRRVEYGIHQIILEVGELSKNHINELNETVSKRLDDLNETVMENHSDVLANLTSKIETELSQVWRQIGTMYQEIAASKATLDRLQQQTEDYVNGTVSAIDTMNGRVSQITVRMFELDSNLNYFLGRLSLVTQEFNDTRAGLSTALEDIRNSFKGVQSEIQDMGPGPHKISSSEKSG